jgi:hypothetical protein
MRGPDVAPSDGTGLSLEALQEDLRADGAELFVESLAGGIAHLRLVLRDAECAECVMPREHLERVALVALRGSHPEIKRVEVHDPREANPA